MSSEEQILFHPDSLKRNGSRNGHGNGTSVGEQNGGGQGLVVGSAPEGHQDKDLHDRIIQQVEFYLSNENLATDKFLQHQLTKNEAANGNIDIKVLASFPKMKQITKDTALVSEALKKSANLEVSPNGKHVRRKVPFILQADEATAEEKVMVYVTHIPKYMDTTAVVNLFSLCGSVVKVDLPLDKKSGEIRGIAFVQYAEPGHVQKAIKFFGLGTNAHKVRVFPYKDPKKGLKEAEKKAPAAEKGLDSPWFETKNVSDAFNDYKESKFRANPVSINLTTQQQPHEWEADPSTAALRPKLSRNIVAEVQPSVQPIRQPLGPQEGKGFRGRRLV